MGQTRVGGTRSSASPTCCGNQSIAAWLATEISTTPRGFPRIRPSGSSVQKISGIEASHLPRGCRVSRPRCWPRSSTRCVPKGRVFFHPSTSGSPSSCTVPVGNGRSFVSARFSFGSGLTELPDFDSGKLRFAGLGIEELGSSWHGTTTISRRWPTQDGLA